MCTTRPQTVELTIQYVETVESSFAKLILERRASPSLGGLEMRSNVNELAYW